MEYVYIMLSVMAAFVSAMAIFCISLLKRVHALGWHNGWEIGLAYQKKCCEVCKYKKESLKDK